MKLKTVNINGYLALVDESAEIKAEGYWVYINPNESFDGVVIENSLPNI